MPQQPEPKEIVETFVNEGISLAQAYGKQIDFTESSVDTVSEMVEIYRKSMPITGLARALKKISRRDILLMANRWGCILGEILRRAYGGQWRLTERAGTACLALYIGSLEIIPVMAAYERLNRSSKYTMREYYDDMVEDINRSTDRGSSL